jgi:hypothetical protein
MNEERVKLSSKCKLLENLRQCSTDKINLRHVDNFSSGIGGTVRSKSRIFRV